MERHCFVITKRGKTGIMTEGTANKGHDNDVAVSSRVRLARNLDKFPFPARMDKDKDAIVVGKVRDAVYGDGDVARELVYVDMQKLNPVDRQVLVEKHLVSPDFRRQS